MDCVDGLKMLDDESIDLTVTSPPYDKLRKYEGYAWSFPDVARELYRVTKKGGCVVWIVGDATVNGSETGTSFRHALGFMDVGFRLHDTMIYLKDSCPFPDSTRYSQVFEYMFIMSKDAPMSVNLIKDKMNKWSGSRVSGTERQPDGSLLPLSAVKRKTNRKIKDFGVRGNVWSINSGYMKTTKDKIAYQHPAIFPEALARDHILSWSKEGDVVLDPFMGSGTTAKMAMILRRNYIGFEISQKYCSIAENRLLMVSENAGLQKSLFAS